MSINQGRVFTRGHAQPNPDEITKWKNFSRYAFCSYEILVESLIGETIDSASQDDIQNARNCLDTWIERGVLKELAPWNSNGYWTKERLDTLKERAAIIISLHKERLEGKSTGLAGRVDWRDVQRDFEQVVGPCAYNFLDPENQRQQMTQTLRLNELGQDSEWPTSRERMQLINDEAQPVEPRYQIDYRVGYKKDWNATPGDNIVSHPTSLGVQEYVMFFQCLYSVHYSGNSQLLWSRLPSWHSLAGRERALLFYVTRDLWETVRRIEEGLEILGIDMAPVWARKLRGLWVPGLSRGQEFNPVPPDHW